LFTINQLQERIANIKTEMEQTKANYAKLEGHLGESVHWLNEMIKKIKESEDKEAEDSDNDEEKDCG